MHCREKRNYSMRRSGFELDEINNFFKYKSVPARKYDR